MCIMNGSLGIKNIYDEVYCCKILFLPQIVEYIDGDYATSDSDNDSDSYDDFSSKLWAYPKSGFVL